MAPGTALRLTMTVYDSDFGDTVIGLRDNGLGVSLDPLYAMFQEGTRRAPDHATGMTC